MDEARLNAYAARRRKIYEARQAGFTYAVIGQLFGITASRAREIACRVERQIKGPRPQEYGPPKPPPDGVWVGGHWELRS